MKPPEREFDHSPPYSAEVRMNGVRNFFPLNDFVKYTGKTT
jgi:hypothetical protein